MKTILIGTLIFLPFLVFSQSSYDLEAMGVWSGKITGEGFQTEEVTIEIKKSRYRRHKGFCIGYMSIGNTGRTKFKGSVFVEADLPYVEWNGSLIGQEIGFFHLEIGCISDDGIEYNVGCGSWSSEDEKTIRRIRVVKQLYNWKFQCYPNKFFNEKSVIKL